MSFKMLVPAANVEQTRKFFRERNGVLLWHNREIGADRPEVMTPAITAEGVASGPPHWAYGQPEPLHPEQIGVRNETIIEPPKEWFPKCTCCAGDGRRTVKSVADARQCSLLAAVELLVGNGAEVVDGTFECNYCQGTGHVERRFLTKLKKYYYGIFPASSAKAERVVARLEQHFQIRGVKHAWEHYGQGLAKLIFYTETIVPFTMEDANAEAHRSGG